MSNPNVQASVSQLDNALLFELLEAAQFALNDECVIKRVAAELRQPPERIEAIAGLAVELSSSDGEPPSISTVSELDAQTKMLAKLKSEFE